MDATSLNTKPEGQKVAILLHVIGEECLKIYNTLNEVSSASMNDILAKFEAYFVSQRNITYERQRLFLHVQREEQSVDDCSVTELRKQLRNCDYGSLNDSILVDQLVRGLRESRFRERLLRVPDLDIKNAGDMCRTAETSKLQAQVYFTEESEHALYSLYISCRAIHYTFDYKKHLLVEYFQSDIGRVFFFCSFLT
ncbi:hypothetical protein AVEN_95543-1 [Araneus ventricosus]|uniref:Retrotransposon gag domain-containing protein n=1 Tax=Araneus ventricosus TaxID=182803 RepID=A0A4Y2SGD8_ARAVE|nr:hypothetical protein AVEN_95543-1 [Araneus ventricosus]